ncbi:autotransporter outer membrane beta-barrel domain-containing protein [Bordetella bronchiseptica]
MDVTPLLPMPSDLSISCKSRSRSMALARRRLAWPGVCGALSLAAWLAPAQAQSAMAASGPQDAPAVSIPVLDGWPVDDESGWTTIDLDGTAIDDGWTHIDIPRPELDGAPVDSEDGRLPSPPEEAPQAGPDASKQRPEGLPAPDANPQPDAKPGAEMKPGPGVEPGSEAEPGPQGQPGPQPGARPQDEPHAQPLPPAGNPGAGIYMPRSGILTAPVLAVLGTASAPQGIWQAEMNALSKRMGELRLTPAAGGVWARSFAQRQRLDNQVVDRFTQTVGGIEIGADTALPAAEGRWHVGAVAGYSRARRKLAHSARGNSDSLHVGAYATYIGDGGFYLDGIVRVNRYEHDFKADGQRGARVTGKYRANGIGLSLETGRRFTWAGDWFVEPQVEVALFRSGGADYTASNGVRVDVASTKSLLGRAGLQVGRKLDLGNGKLVQPYAKLSWLQEFDGVGKVRTNDIGHDVKLRGGRAELDLGVAAALGRHSSLFASYEYSKGSRLTIPWSFHVGYRYAW